LKKNICIIGLATNFTKTVAKALSDKLEMFYADINDLLKFDLLDIEEAEKKCGKAYITKLEKNKIKTVAGYNNTIITVNYSSLTSEENIKHIRKNAIIIYLKLSKTEYEQKLKTENLSPSKETLFLSVFNDRDFISSKICDLIINCKTLTNEQIVDLIIKSVLKYYK
jgi:shikimate kinase